MTRYDKRFWFLAAGVSSIAGYVDATGFLKLGGLFVSFMSGNSTRLAVGTMMDPQVSIVAGRLIGGFVAGVVAGTIVAALAGSRRKPATLGFVSVLLVVAAVINTNVSDVWTTTVMAMAMGSANAIFQRDGEVTIGVTYMTGTLVKFGQRIAGALMGGAPFAWLPYLLLWLGLVGGAVLGTTAYVYFRSANIWLAVAASGLLALYATVLGPVEPAAGMVRVRTH